jgi:hypothetical protein
MLDSSISPDASWFPVSHRKWQQALLTTASHIQSQLAVPRATRACICLFQRQLHIHLHILNSPKLGNSSFLVFVPLPPSIRLLGMIQAMQLKKGVPYKETIFLPSPQKNSKVSVPRKWVLKSICGLGIVFLEREKNWLL